MKHPTRTITRSFAPTGDGSFIRGFVASACLSAFQDVPQPASRKNLKRVLRHALQGGAALTAGGHAVSALRQRNYASALIAAAAGAASVFAIEQLLREAAPTKHDNQEKKNGQEA